MGQAAGNRTPLIWAVPHVARAEVEPVTRVVTALMAAPMSRIARGQAATILGVRTISDAAPPGSTREDAVGPPVMAATCGLSAVRLSAASKRPMTGSQRPSHLGHLRLILIPGRRHRGTLTGIYRSS